MKLLRAALVLLLLLILSSSFSEADLSGDALKNFCAGKCWARCVKASFQDRCLKFCGLCCAECKCVPSGTYGNKDECPCYRDKLTAPPKRKPKCP